MNLKKPYYAKSKVKNENIIFCTFDTETAGLGGDILCCTYSTPSGTGAYIGVNSAIEWLDKVFFSLPSPCIHYAHFAQYDWRYILPELIKREKEFDKLDLGMRTDKDVYQITIKKNKKKYIMRDSYAVYSAPLKDFAEQFSPGLLKLSIDFDKVIFDPNNPEHIEYAKRDAEVLRQCLINYNSSLQKLFHVSIGHTAAGTAVKGWQQSLSDEIIVNYSEDGEKEQFIRDAYYGGIVFLTSNAQHKNCKTIDINSSYPYVMQTYPMPVGSPKIVDDYVPGMLAIYEVDIETPINISIPILPCRDLKGNMQWRQGRFTTKVTNFELEFAIQNGYYIHEIKQGYVWKNTLNPFFDFVETCKSIRTEHKGTAYEKIAKLMQNSLYGKFGAKRQRTKIAIGRENVPPEVDAQLISPDFGHLYSYPEYSPDMACKPEWACFITAYARLRLISTAYALGVENVLYGDTDSLTVKESADLTHADIGSNYGQFKLEKEWACFRAIAPKTYAGRLLNGKWKGAGKGLATKKMEQRQYRELYENGGTSVEYETLPSLTVALKKGIVPATLQTRVSSKIENSVNYHLQNGAVRLKSTHVQNLSIPAKAA